MTQTRHLYDRLGPGPVLDSFLGQHQLIHHLLHSNAGTQWRSQPPGHCGNPGKTPAPSRTSTHSYTSTA